MLDTVAIEMPGETSIAEADRALSGCRIALGNEHCVLAGGEESSRATLTATLTKAGERELVVELYRSHHARNDAREPSLGRRHLRFDAADPEAYHWQTAGVVVASMVLSAQEIRDDATPAEAQPFPAPATVRPTAFEVPRKPEPRTSSAYELRMDVEGLGGPGLSGGDPRWGGLVRASYALDAPLFLVGDFRLAASDDRVQSGAISTLWVTGALGAGGRLTNSSGSLALEVSSEVTMESLQLKARDATLGDATSRGRFGGRLGLLGEVRVHRFFGLIVGADANLSWPGLDLEVGGVSAGRLSTFSWAGHAGLRFWIFRVEPER